MAIQTHNSKLYTMNPDGSVKTVVDSTIDLDLPTKEELIAQKEAKLLEMYEEIERLKQK